MSKIVSRVLDKFENTDFLQFLKFIVFYCESSNLSTNTIECYIERTGYLFKYCQNKGIAVEDINRSVIREYISSLISTISISSINGRIRAYKRVWNIWSEEGLWNGEIPLQDVQFLREPKRIKEILTPKSVQKVLDSFNLKTFEGTRNYLMTLFMWDGMLRKSEVLGIKICDLNLATGMVKVTGKGNKEGMVPLGINTIRFINKYLAKWRIKYPGEYLLCMRNGLPIVGRNCNQIYERISEKIKIHVHPHLFRHSAATYFIKSGGNIAILQKIMRHSSIKVTIDIYGHLSDEDTRESYKLHSPASSLKIKRA